MKKYIGIDAHCKYCDIAVVGEKGNLLSHTSVKTSAENLCAKRGQIFTLDFIL